MDLKGMLETELSSAFKTKLANQHGIDKSVASNAVDSAVNTLLNGLHKNVQTTDGATALDNTLASKHAGGSVPDTAAAAAGSFIQQEGAKILGHIFGGQTNEAATKVAKNSGVKTGIAESILSSVAPLILGQLGKAKQSGNLDAQGVVNMLSRSLGGK